MRKKKKWIVVLCCIGVFTLMAMGNDSSETRDIVTEDTSGSNETYASGEEAGVIEEAGVTEGVEPSGEGVTIDEQVLVDQDGIVITAKEYVTDVIWGDGIKLLIENNSEQNVSIGCTALIVNDYMISDFFVSDVAAGKKANETMYLSSTELKAAGIDSVGQVEVYFHVYESDSYENVFDTDVVTIQTSEYENMDTTADDSGTELYNEGGIRIVGKTVDENSFWGTAILLYIENTSGENVGVQCNNMSINGFMMTPYFSCDVYDGKKAISDIMLMSSELEENGIESIEEVELTFHIYDVNTYMTITDSDPIIFYAQ